LELKNFQGKLVIGIRYFDSIKKFLAKVVSYSELLKDLTSKNGSGGSK